jgi:outer membrane receptor protein involved in Fe transport
LKLFGEVAITSRLDLDADLIAASRSYARGNENNAHAPDGVYYLGDGTVPGYAIMNLGVRYALTRQWQIRGQVSNLLDRRYATGAQLGTAGFAADGTFVARPFPPVDGEYPLRHTTFVAPGAPLRGWVDLRVHF